MNASEVALTMLVFLLLRLALPLIVTLVFGYTMNRLVDRWNANIDR
jgi:hypothetical protein